MEYALDKKVNTVLECGSGKVLSGLFKRFSQDFNVLNLETIEDLKNLEKVEKLITPKTKLIWVETPTNPMINVIDIAAISKICKKNNILLGVDNTFSTTTTTACK